MLCRLTRLLLLLLRERVFGLSACKGQRGEQILGITDPFLESVRIKDDGCDRYRLALDVNDPYPEEVTRPESELVRKLPK